MKLTGKAITLFLGSILFSYLSYSYVKDEFNPFELSSRDRMNQILIICNVNIFGNLYFKMRK